MGTSCTGCCGKRKDTPKAPRCWSARRPRCRRADPQNPISVYVNNTLAGAALTDSAIGGSIGGVNNRIRCWNPYPDRRRERPCEAWQPVTRAAAAAQRSPTRPPYQVPNPASAHDAKMRGSNLSPGSPIYGAGLYLCPRFRRSGRLRPAASEEGGCRQRGANQYHCPPCRPRLL